MIMVGKDRGKQGKIEKVNAKEQTVTLPGLNVFKRHMKKRDEQRPGGIIEFSRPLTASNVAYVCPTCKKTTRIGYKVTKGDKERVCKKCGNTV